MYTYARDVMCVSVAPIVSLRLGNSIDPNGIKEGDDVYFDCHVKANPPSTKLTWYHNVSVYILFIREFTIVCVCSNTHIVSSCVIHSFPYYVYYVELSIARP